VQSLSSKDWSYKPAVRASGARARRGTGMLVRHGDDFAVLCSSRQQAGRAQRAAAGILGELGLALHRDKTPRGRPAAGQGGF